VTRAITIGLILFTVTALVIWDIYVATNKEEGDTESEVIRDWSRYPALPYGLGALLGHWTLVGFRILESGFHGLFAVLGIGALLLAWSLLVQFHITRGAAARLHAYIARRRYLPAIFGYVTGGFLWGLAPAEGVPE
jgi:hypothetical protein